MSTSSSREPEGRSGQARRLTARHRLYLSAACLAAWMVLLFSGFALGGGVHALLLVALVVFPWR